MQESNQTHQPHRWLRPVLETTAPAKPVLRARSPGSTSSRPRQFLMELPGRTTSAGLGCAQSGAWFSRAESGQAPDIRGKGTTWVIRAIRELSHVRVTAGPTGVLATAPDAAGTSGKVRARSIHPSEMISPGGAGRLRWSAA
jgi:hypothetical protein